MQPPGGIQIVAVFLNDGLQNFRQQHVLLPRLLFITLQIQPAEQLLFLPGKLHKAHAIIAVATIGMIRILRGLQEAAHPLGMGFHGSPGQGLTELIHVFEAKIDGLGGTTQLLGHVSGVDGGKALLPQHLFRCLKNGFCRYFSTGRHTLLQK